MWKHAKWLGIPQKEIKEKEIYHGDLGGRFAYFRCDKELPAGCSLTLPAGTSGLFRFPEGREVALHEGSQLLKEE